MEGGNFLDELATVPINNLPRKKAVPKATTVAPASNVEPAVPKKATPNQTVAPAINTIDTTRPDHLDPNNNISV
jgi:hypothetical protein